MEIWKAAILGIVQGLTEFLPVSSSGHLILAERLFRINLGNADLFFSIMMHVGTLFSVIVVYWSKIIAAVKENRKLILYLIAATLPGAAAGLLLGNAVDKLFFGGEWLWLFFLMTAILLWGSQKRMQHGYLPHELNLKRSFAIGVAQALAIIPGLSRSGTTVAAGIFVGLKKEDSADFSLLMSIPMIAGALFVQGCKLFRSTVEIVAIPWQSLTVGMVFAAIFGIIGIKTVLKTVQKCSFFGYAVYLMILSSGLLFLKIF